MKPIFRSSSRSPFHGDASAQPAAITRRDVLHRSATGFGALALAGLVHSESAAAPRLRHTNGPAKNVIHVFLNGGMSQVDTFDPKPELTKRAGQMLPVGNLVTERKTGVALPSPFKFQRHGQSGTPVSDIFPRLAKCVDDMAVIRSMQAELPNHEQSLILMNCGDQRAVRPSFGSWLTYGLGSENANLPGFIALCPGGLPVAGAENWRSAFLPGGFQATHIDSAISDPTQLIEHIRNGKLTPQQQQVQVDLLQRLNRRHLAERPQEVALEARIESFELAYRMQSEALEAFDLSHEPQYLLDLYGAGIQNRQLLIARRLVERGVRFVQVWHGAGQPWDSHSNIAVEHRNLANQCDSGLAALIIDLKQRGLLDETLILCTGEFGRTPSVEMGTDGSGAGQGRDHNHWGYSLWLAGGGIKGGTIYGATDEFGFQAIENPVSVHDLHATMLYLLGIDHQRLTYRFAGRDYRLTDLYGNVVHDVIA